MWPTHPRRVSLYTLAKRLAQLFYQKSSPEFDEGKQRPSQPQTVRRNPPSQAPPASGAGVADPEPRGDGEGELVRSRRMGGISEAPAKSPVAGPVVVLGLRIRVPVIFLGSPF